MYIRLYSSTRGELRFDSHYLYRHYQGFLANHMLDMLKNILDQPITGILDLERVVVGEIKSELNIVTSTVNSNILDRDSLIVYTIQLFIHVLKVRRVSRETLDGPLCN